MNSLIIIPTYNEIENVSIMIEALFDNYFKNKDISVLIIDSGSVDGTADKVEDLMKKYRNLYLIKEEKKSGLASAYLKGFEYALNKNFDRIVQLDCDFQHPIDKLEEMINCSVDYDLVIGSRYVKDGCWTYNKNFIKKMISLIGSKYSKLILNCPINDLTGGFNIWSRKSLEIINLDNIKSKGYCFQIEMKYKAYKNNLKIYEYPISFNKRMHGKSKLSIKIIVEAMLKCWIIKFYK